MKRTNRTQAERYLIQRAGILSTCLAPSLATLVEVSTAAQTYETPGTTPLERYCAADPSAFGRAARQLKRQLEGCGLPFLSLTSDRGWEFTGLGEVMISGRHAHPQAVRMSAIAARRLSERTAFR